MSDNDNVKLTRGVYAAFAAGDIPGILSIFAPDIHWTEALGGPYGGVSIGPDAVVQNVFMRIGTEWDGYQAIPHEFVATGDTVVALGTYSGTYRQTGKSFTAPFAHVWKFKDGKVVRFEQITDTAVHSQPLQP
ncbi:MAG: nuclear transport factor 2 family protein [Gammaproteobacteria bacterium]|nr:nuclear transport factor 2 family protein [Gammaproteobacteria bacterium]MDH5226923.1 nuclear transport factor 2 family protein [Gammaproteobacteria bacterium]